MKGQLDLTDNDFLRDTVEPYWSHVHSTCAHRPSPVELVALTMAKFGMVQSRIVSQVILASRVPFGGHNASYD